MTRDDQRRAFRQRTAGIICKKFGGRVMADHCRSFHQRAQLAHRQPHAGFHGTERNAESLGDFALRPVLKNDRRITSAWSGAICARAARTRVSRSTLSTWSLGIGSGSHFERFGQNVGIALAAMKVRAQIARDGENPCGR